MNRYAGLAILLTLLWPGHASAAGRPACGPKAAKTVIQNERMRIYRERGEEVVCSRYSPRRWEHRCLRPGRRRAAGSGVGRQP